jgi:hypothetical protein
MLLRVRYTPHPYVWMTPVAAHSMGLVIESEVKEVPLGDRGCSHYCHMSCCYLVAVAVPVPVVAVIT